jgi:hypothetical protein
MKELVLELNSDAHSSEDKDISAQSDSNTDSETDDVTNTNFTQWADNTKLSTYCAHSGLQGVPVGYDKQNHPTSIKTLLHIVSTARQGRQAPSMSQLKRLDTRNNRHWLMHCDRIQCRVCSTENVETRTKF